MQSKKGIRIREVTVKITEKNSMYYKPIVDLFENNPNTYDFKLKIESKVSFSNTVKKS